MALGHLLYTAAPFKSIMLLVPSSADICCEPWERLLHEVPRRHLGFYATETKTVAVAFHSRRDRVCSEGTSAKTLGRQPGEATIEMSLKLLAVKTTSPAAPDRTIYHQV